MPFGEDKEWNVNYWAKKLQETATDAKPILKKMNYSLYNAPLTTEELYKLRDILQDYSSYAELLGADLAKPDPTPPSPWKKLFRK